LPRLGEEPYACGAIAAGALPTTVGVLGQALKPEPVLARSVDARRAPSARSDAESKLPPELGCGSAAPCASAR
jgi:hypothetical protein